MLRSYRIAHSRVQSVEAFETSLRENTPLTSISDPNALVEYLNQVTLKGDMVVDELKRVTNERNDYKQKLAEAEQRAKDAWDEVTQLRKHDQNSKEEVVNGRTSADEKEAEDVVEGDPLGATKKSPPASIKSPTTSLRSMSLFSPKPKPVDSPTARTGSIDLFSFDGELPRLQSELEEKRERITVLERELQNIKGDLSVTRESTQSMVQTLEEATRELNGLRDIKERSEAEIKELQTSMKTSTERLQGELQSSKEKLENLQKEATAHEAVRVAELESELHSIRDKLERTQLELKEKSEECLRLADLQNVANELKAQISEAEKRNGELVAEIEKSAAQIKSLQSPDKKNDIGTSPGNHSGSSSQGKKPQDEANDSASKSLPDAAASQDTGPSAKKKNKKKKKGTKGPSEHEKDTAAEQIGQSSVSAREVEQATGSETMESLMTELKRLKSLIDEKDAALDRINLKLKDQDDLREEIESLRDDLINVGQEHVATKDKAKDLVAEKKAVEAKVAEQQVQIDDLQSKLVSRASSDDEHKEIARQFEELKVKASTLQTDLSAAQQLASTRFKDLNDLRTSLQKAQPEINALRSEAAEVRSVKEALGKREAELKRLDSRHEEMDSELTRLKQTISTKDSEIKVISQKLEQESGNRLKAEEGNAKISQELHRLETEKRQATESLDRLSKDLVKSREDLLTNKSRLRELEQQIPKYKSESEGLREKVELKSAQYASAQSLMSSMRDQTSEMATQLKEARERCESLDEEVADAHRLLSERSREGETMRRLLADVEGRADARTREMKERMDNAIEERDRIEDEASTAGRRRARELEELRNKLRDVERNLRRAEEDREELEAAQKDWKRRREDLENRSEQSTTEANEVRKAMSELRDALDESERQARELEKQRNDLRRSVEETQQRLEKLQKTNKVRFFSMVLLS